MKLYKFILTAMLAMLLCPAIFAADDDGEDTEYKMPDGRILKNPYIMETKPNGVVVGHTAGVMFVKYKKMPEALRKKLGYNPEKCAKYEKKLRKRKNARARQKAEKKAHDAELEKKMNARMNKYKITELEDKIRATELHIARIKKEIPRLESESKTYLNDAVGLASNSNSNNNNNGFWRGGSWGSSSIRRNSASRTEVKNRHRAVKAIGDEYSKSKFRLENYRDDLEKKTLELEKMKRRLKQLKAKQGQKGGGSFLGNIFG